MHPALRFPPLSCHPQRLALLCKHCTAASRDFALKERVPALGKTPAFRLPLSLPLPLLDFLKEQTTALQEDLSEQEWPHDLVKKLQAFYCLGELHSTD